MKEDSPQLASVLVPFAASFMLTGAVVVLLCKPPLHPSLDWPRLVALTLVYVVLAASAHASAIWLACKVFREHIELSPRTLIYGLWMSSAWLPLLALLERQHSVWVAGIPPLILISAAAFLKNTIPTAQPSFSPATSTLFQNQEPPSLLRALLPAALTSIAFQAALLALLFNFYATAGLLFALCAAFPFWLSPRKPLSHAPGKQARPFAPMVGSLVVLLLTALALVPFLKSGGFPSGLSSLLQITQANAASSLRIPSLNHVSGSDYSGVILFVPAKPPQKILPPAPVSHNQFSIAVAKPIVIPFDGAYWYFKPPDRRPRPDARIVHGDPTQANVRSTDFASLSMEAHQYLGTPIKMTCCSALRVAVHNADNRAGTISLEVLLKHASAVPPYIQSLGTVLLRSSAIQPISLNRPPIDEILNFPIPSGIRGNQFDEITVVVRAARERSRAGAHIAIQNFVLVP